MTSNLSVFTETEKYAHVTFFFNGGQEAQFEGEDRQLVPSPKVATYDLKPEMSAQGVADEVMIILKILLLLIIIIIIIIITIITIITIIMMMMMMDGDDDG